MEYKSIVEKSIDGRARTRAAVERSANTNQAVPWRVGVHCQRFFKQGPKSGIFRGSKSRSKPRKQSSQPGIASQTDQYKAAKQESRRSIEESRSRRERRVIKEAEEARRPNPWLRRVGWAAHIWPGWIGQNCRS